LFTVAFPIKGRHLLLLKRRCGMEKARQDIIQIFAPLQKEEVSALDREGDSEMKDAEVAKDGEVVTILAGSGETCLAVLGVLFCSARLKLL
jgi:hypothetical protein